jgi:RHS repeat-associated protein
VAARFTRLQKVTYPGPSTRREVYYNYPTDSGIGDHLSRLDNMANDSGGNTQFAQYAFLGAGTILKVSHPSVPTGLDLTYGSNGSYTGFDRFGRVVDQKWQNGDGSVIRDQYRYGYDRGSNRTWRENTLRHLAGTNPKLDEFYTYDGLSRLMTMDRGTLTSTVSGGPYTHIDGTPRAEEDWSLDALGNWSGYVRKTAGTVALNQTRTHNAVNEIDVDNDHTNTPGEAIASTEGANWVDPRYDAAGNMTEAPEVDHEGSPLTYVYDAWNRLVQVKYGESIEDEMRYDGLGRRISRISRYRASFYLSYIRTDFYYNESWQVVEERRLGDFLTVEGDAELEDPGARNVVPEDVAYQYLWDVRYIDAPVCRWSGEGEDVQTLYYCNDANMNVTALVNGSTGSVVERYLYEAYGKPTFRGANWTSQYTYSNYGNELLYCGYRWDTGLNLYHIRNRTYHPTLGRWVQRDPLCTQKDIAPAVAATSVVVASKDGLIFPGVAKPVVIPGGLGAYATDEERARALLEQVSQMLRTNFVDAVLIIDSISPEFRRLLQIERQSLLGKFVQGGLVGDAQMLGAATATIRGAVPGPCNLYEIESVANATDPYGLQAVPNPYRGDPCGCTWPICVAYVRDPKLYSSVCGMVWFLCNDTYRQTRNMDQSTAVAFRWLYRVWGAANGH